MYLASENIGALWFGIGRPQNIQRNGLDFVIMLETCLEHENYSYDRLLYEDTTDDSVEKTLVAKYEFHAETIERK